MKILSLFPSVRKLEEDLQLESLRATHAEDEVRFWRDKATDYERLFREERDRHSTSRESLEDWLAMQHTGSPIHNRQTPQLPAERMDLSEPEPKPQKRMARDYVRELETKRREESIGSVLAELDEMTRASA